LQAEVLRNQETALRTQIDERHGRALSGDTAGIFLQCPSQTDAVGAQSIGNPAQEFVDMKPGLIAHGRKLDHLHRMALTSGLLLQCILVY